MSGVKTLLIQMSAAGRELLAIGEVEEASPKLAVVQGIAVEHSHLAEARKLPKDYSIHLWSTLQQEKIVLADVARAFGAVMTLAPRSHALRAAAVYTSLLMAPGCPVRSMKYT